MTEAITYFGTGKDGDHSFLSNFYRESPDRLTIEHFYQAAKTNDPEWKEKILLAESPAIAKKLGRQAPIRPDWDDIKIDIMRELLSSKFAQGTEMSRKLIATGDAELIEGNWWGDKFWGQVDGQGENHLGKLLMWIREGLNPQLAFDRHADAHTLQIDAASDTECVVCGWAGCLSLPLPPTCIRGQFC